MRCLTMQIDLAGVAQKLLNDAGEVTPQTDAQTLRRKLRVNVTLGFGAFKVEIKQHAAFHLLRFLFFQNLRHLS